MTRNRKILLADDEEDILEILAFNLEGEGYDIEKCTSAEEALKKDLASFDLLILDVMMGPMSGFRLAEKIRKELKLMTPVIFLTARNTENDRITGFNLGADDYIAKPFSVRELTARVKAILRRSAPTEAEQGRLPDGFSIDPVNGLIRMGNSQPDLTRKESEILSLLVRNQGRIFSREEMLNSIWGDGVIVTERTVDVTIARLRRKIGEKGKMIKNKTGYGYYYGE